MLIVDALQERAALRCVNECEDTERGLASSDEEFIAIAIRDQREESQYHRRILNIFLDRERWVHDIRRKTKAQII
jgi:hypothetical protein